jgi:antibiotic biosynthesis monooxygenase (ABM) superfamily enzyme
MKDTMNTSTNDNYGTSVIVHDVHPTHRDDYERWMLKATQTHQTFPGYLATDVIRPIGTDMRFVIVIRFADAASAHAWLISDVRAALLDQASEWLFGEDRYRVHENSEFWFTPPHPGPAPKRWKQWLLSALAVFPLTVIIPWLVHTAGDPLVLGLPVLLVKAIIAAMISGVMVYWLMPTFVRLAGKWLVR